jgi:hypothetical protein
MSDTTTVPTPLTHSAILDFACGYRYQQIHLKGLHDTSDPAQRGQAIHVANQLYVEKLAAAGTESDPGLAQWALHEALVTQHTPAHLVPEVESLWLDWVERFQFDVEGFLLAEQRQVVDARFSFKPDLVFARPEALTVADLKTHWQGLNETAAKADLQARMYSCLARHVWPGFPRYRFVFEFIRLRYAVPAEFTPAELDAIDRQLVAHEAAIARAQATGDYPAVPGETCKYCHLRCPLEADAERLPARIIELDDAKQTAGELLVLKQALAAKHKLLEQFCALSGPVVAGGVEWAHRPTETVTFPAVPVLDVLTGAAADTSKLHFGKTILKSFLTAQKWFHVRAPLEALAQIKHGTEFSAKKVAAVGDEEQEE